MMSISAVVLCLVAIFIVTNANTTSNYLPATNRRERCFRNYHFRNATQRSEASRHFGILQYANVSQIEYERAHEFYLNTLALSRNNPYENVDIGLVVAPAFDPETASEERSTKFGIDINSLTGCDTITHCLYFYVELLVRISWLLFEDPEPQNPFLHYVTLRFLLEGDSNGSHNLKISISRETSYLFHFPRYFEENVALIDPTKSQWLEYDLTYDISDYLYMGHALHGYLIRFSQNGQYIPRKISNATLYIFTKEKSIMKTMHRRKRSTQGDWKPESINAEDLCDSQNDKCCLQEKERMFKDLRGFDFVVYPKGVKGTYCRGSCPEDAMAYEENFLRNTINNKNVIVNRPVCLPKKFAELMILHYDEKDRSQLKVSYWPNMIALKCSCV